MLSEEREIPLKTICKDKQKFRESASANITSFNSHRTNGTYTNSDGIDNSVKQ